MATTWNVGAMISASGVLVMVKVGVVVLVYAGAPMVKVGLEV